MATYTARPGTVTTDESGEAWDDISKVMSEDGDYAQIVDAIGNEYGARAPFFCTNFGFSIPSYHIIDGIEVRVKCYGTETHQEISDVWLLHNGSLYGTPKTGIAMALSTSLTDMFIGSNNDLWGETPDYSIINDSTFGVYVALDDPSTSGDDLTYVDVIELIVYTTAGSPPVTDPDNIVFKRRLINSELYPAEMWW